MIEQAIENLIQFEINHGIITNRDITYVRNQIYYLIQLTFDETKNITPKDIMYPNDALDVILDDLEKRKILDGSQISRDLFDAKIMNIFADKPSVVAYTFDKIYQNNRRDAMLWYYEYAKSLNYIRMDRIHKNKAFIAHTSSGDLQITINLSKPEKDPKSIAMQANQKTTNYPKCVLCVENEGFSGHAKRQSRDQHRMIEFDLNGKNWYFQYSPYIYYNEHAIVISKKHTPMVINEETFRDLCLLVDKFDGYFFGSNADLPIVGGSILSHSHYQGGIHDFPIEKADAFYEETYKDYQLQLLKWPLSTIKLISKDKDVLIKKANSILKSWINYENKDLDIIAYTNQIRHHTITPVVKKVDGTYHMYLILRDNHTTDKHPLGVFHPHKDVWHIKKENIGLIEAIGLAILPKRLVIELDAVKAYVKYDTKLPKEFNKHLHWANDIKKDYQKHMDIDQFIEKMVGMRFERVLVDCGVFKLNKDKQIMISFIKGVE